MKNQAVNPYLPSYEYVPDGEPYVFGDRIYIYGSHDQFNGSKFCMRDYVCWSASVQNLAEWQYEGIIYGKEQDIRLPDAKERRLFAPDVQKGVDGRYYLYYAFDFSGTIGVAVSETPAGAYTYYGYVQYPDGTALGEGKEDVFQYDPGVLVDDNGSVYLYSGFCPLGETGSRFCLPKPIAEGALVIELESDMITVKRKPELLIPNAEHTKGSSFAGHGFFEAASIRKVGGIYYFIYSSEHGHELCYATSLYPDKDFIYGGVIISNGDIGYEGRTDALNYTGTNHGSIVEIADKWYVFYHRQTNGNPYSRQGCAEKIEILKDGSIPQVEMTSCGLNGKPLKGNGWYNAGIASCLMSEKGAVPYEAGRNVPKGHPFFTQDGEDRENLPGQYIAHMQAGAVAGYKYFEIEEVHQISIKVRGTGLGEMKVYTEIEKECFLSLHIQPSEDWQIISKETVVGKGMKSLWFRYEGSGEIDFESFALA